ncbi:MAG TPA: hypothetical protein VIN10_10095 [Bacteroidales bacterium]
MKKFFKIFFGSLATLILVPIAILLSMYLFAPVYEFSEPVPFSGTKLYNPYQNMDYGFWRKYNFQVQSKAWGGVTSGSSNTNELIDSVYNALGFDYVATSDYMKINYHGDEKANFIPTYEHGYNWFKTHQVCIDAKKVLWVDFIFYQNLNMKQWIIDLLQKNSQIVVLAHPTLRDGYALDDMKYLTNYNYIEVLNNMRTSIEHWDVALSSGQMAWIMGNDDAHDVLNPNHVGRKFTMINSPSTTRHTIVQNLKSGKAYAVDFYPKMDVPLEERIERSRDIPYLRDCDLSNDNLTIVMSEISDSIRFIGQNGKVLQTTANNRWASYKIKNEDTYVRAEIYYPEQTTIYLNPILRYEGDYPRSMKLAIVNESSTMAMHSMYVVVLFTITWFVFRRRIKKFKQKRERKKEQIL